MFSLRSVKGRSLLAGLALLLLLAGIAALAIWRTQSERSARNSLEQRAFGLSALESARAQIFLVGTYTALSAFADDPTFFVGQYEQLHTTASQTLREARDKLAAVGDEEGVAKLDAMAAKIEQLLTGADTILGSFEGMSKEQRLEAARQNTDQMWPSAAPLIAEMDQFQHEQEAMLSAERAAADSASEKSLALLIALSALSFLVASGILFTFISSLVRPLASLQASARAIISGDLQARAKESGPTEVVSVARDVNEMTQALLDRTERLLQSEQQFRDVLDISRDLVYKLNTETRTYDYVSPSASELLGFTAEEIVEMGVDGIRARFHPEDAAAFRTPRGDLPPDAARDHEGLSIEYRWKVKSGDYRWLSDDRAIVRDDKGKVLAVVGTVRDITNRRAADDALRESEERFRTLSASAPIGIFLADVRGNAVYSNENAVALVDGTLEDGLGFAWTKFIHPDDREAVKAETTVAIASRRKFSMEYRILTRAGQERWVHTTMIATRSPEGVVTGYVGTIEDVTDRKRTEEEMANRLRMESAIAQASNILAGPADVDAALDLALPILAEAFGAERAAVFVVRGKNRVDAVSTWRAPGVPKIDNLHDRDIAAFPWLSDELARGEPVIVPDVSALPPEAAREKKDWEDTGNRSMLAFPVTSRGRSTGGVIFHNTKSTLPWREEDIRLLRLASESISSFIERQRAGAEKRKAYESIVLLLATAAEARDPYTENHLHRIKNFSEAIALELGLSPEEAQEIGFATLLHDLGKVRVPDSILMKPGPLSEEEWQVMRKHPIWGEELLPPDPSFKSARQIARWHHENWNGSGYPDGLDSDMIPLSATIVAVADGFDPLTSQRPYKGPRPPVRAMREITKECGKRYSPAVVDAFLRAVEKGEIDRIVVSQKPKPPDLQRAA